MQCHNTEFLWNCAYIVRTPYKRHTTFESDRTPITDGVPCQSMHRSDGGCDFTYCGHHSARLAPCSELAKQETGGKDGRRTIQERKERVVSQGRWGYGRSQRQVHRVAAEGTDGVFQVSWM